MFTVFVNLSPGLDVGRHLPLMNELQGSGRLLVMTSRLEDLRACAAELAGRISWAEDLGEKFNIIVYTEVGERNEAALASEHILRLQIEETLFAPLYERGRKAKQALILFGENFDRGRQYGAGKDYRLKVKQRFWEMFPVPTVDDTRDYLRELQGKYPEDQQEEFSKAFIRMLEEHKTGSSPLYSDSRFVQSTLQEMADSVRKDKWDEVDFQSELYNAVCNQWDSVRSPVTEDLPEYAYVRLRDSDPNALSRSTFSILLFVCLCASAEGFPLEEQKAADKELTPANRTIPEVDWDEVDGELEHRRNMLGWELSQLGMGRETFPQFNSAQVKRKNMDGYKPPKLTETVQKRIGLTVGQLQKAAGRMVAEIRAANRENEDKISVFVARLTDGFNRDKDRQMRELNYKSDSAVINTDTLTESFIRDRRIQADVSIIRKKRLSAVASDIEEALKLAEQRIDYCFECMKAGKSLGIALAAFLLLIGVPYLTIVRQLGETDLGWLYFVSTLAVAALAFGLGCLLFDFYCRQRILSELATLSEKFTQLQREKSKALEEYKTLLELDIPMSYCLELYEKEFRAYQGRKSKGELLITYHKNQLGKYLDYVTQLRGELGLSREEGTEFDPIGSEKQLKLDRDVYKNDAVYCVIPASRMETCFKGVEEGENK